jgi:hypothetical protein
MEKEMGNQAELPTSRRSNIVRDALSALWLSLAAGLCAAMMLILIVVLLAGAAEAAFAEHVSYMEPGDARGAIPMFSWLLRDTYHLISAS